MREQQPQRQMPQTLPGSGSDEPTGQATERKGQPAVTVRGFTFSGHEGLVSEQELRRLTNDRIGTEMSFGELQGLASKITLRLKADGWFLARAYLPDQDVTSGIVHIAILQGKSDGQFTIERDPGTRICKKTIRGFADRAAKPGAPLNQQRLERAVLLINDLPGISAKASLTTGSTPGSTSIRLDVSEGPLLSGSAWTDNQGNRYTGAWRGNARLVVNDPFGCGDQYTLLLTGAEGIAQGRIGYRFPITCDGLKGNLAYTGMGYKIVEGEAVSLQPKGQSHSIDAGVTYPLLRSRATNITTTAGYQFKTLSDRSAGETISDKRLHSGSFGLGGDRFDTLLGGGYGSWSISITAGSLHQEIADASSPNTDGAFMHFNTGLSRLQRLADRLTIALSWNAQHSLNNLDSSEKFYLGGPYGVRAYPVGEASGDEGHLFNIDLRYELPIPAAIGAVQLSGFYDAGRIRLHKDPWINSVSTATGINEYWLQGAGIGLDYTSGNSFSLKATWAHAIGANGGRDTNGNNVDGKGSDNRFWLNASFYF